MPETPAKTELELVNDITKSLENFQPRDRESKDRLTEALANLVQVVPLDLNKMEERELMATDSVAQGRRLYIGSLLRLWHYLAREPGGMDQEAVQAKVALGFIKHAEGSRSLSVHLGRTKGDETLMDDVTKLKQQLQDVIEKKMELKKARIVNVEAS